MLAKILAVTGAEQEELKLALPEWMRLARKKGKHSLRLLNGTIQVTMVCRAGKYQIRVPYATKQAKKNREWILRDEFIESLPSDLIWQAEYPVWGERQGGVADLILRGKNTSGMVIVEFKSRGDFSSLERGLGQCLAYRKSLQHRFPIVGCGVLCGDKPSLWWRDLYSSHGLFLVSLAEADQITCLLTK